MLCPLMVTDYDEDQNITRSCQERAEKNAFYTSQFKICEFMVICCWFESDEPGDT